MGTGVIGHAIRDSHRAVFLEPAQPGGAAVAAAVFRGTRGEKNRWGSPDVPFRDPRTSGGILVLGPFVGAGTDKTKGAVSLALRPRFIPPSPAAGEDKSGRIGTRMVAALGQCVHAGMHLAIIWGSPSIPLRSAARPLPPSPCARVFCKETGGRTSERWAATRWGGSVGRAASWLPHH